MRIFYSLLFYCLTPLLVLRMLWRSRKNPAYRQRLGERFGLQLSTPNRAVIWVHAVSVGETLAAVPLVQSLLDSYPSHQVLVTTTTPTGSARVRASFGERVLHVYAPYDLPGSVARFVARFKPDIAIIMETEIWPNLFTACQKRGVPIIVANARLSPKSARGYSKFAALTRATLKCIHTIACQTNTDAERFRQLGATAAQVRVIGSIKFDLQLPEDLTDKAASLRRDLGQQRKVWIAASTHEGEDEQVIAAYQQMQHVLPDLLLVLVPRHPERFDRVAMLCDRHALKLVRRSSGQACTIDTQVYLGDTMGELLLLYAAADIAFVGGSLVPVGGHNLLEPAALGVASIIGPSVFNFAEITMRLRECQGLLQIDNAQQLADSVGMLLRDEAQRKLMGQNALRFVELNRGALGRLRTLIEELMVAGAK